MEMGMSVIDWIDAHGTFVECLLAAGAMVLAVFGFKSWRREMRGKTQYALARRVLADVYAVRNAISIVRSMFMGGEEFAARPGRNPKSKESTPEDVLYAYEKRWDRLAEPSNKLDLDLIEAEVLWGKALQDHATELRGCIIDLQFNLSQHLRILRDERFAQRLPDDDHNKITAVVYAGMKNDALAKRVNKAVGGFEAVLKRHIQ